MEESLTKLKRKLCKKEENLDYFQKLEGISEEKRKETANLEGNFRKKRKDTLKKKILALGRKH